MSQCHKVCVMDIIPEKINEENLAENDQNPTAVPGWIAAQIAQTRKNMKKKFLRGKEVMTDRNKRKKVCFAASSGGHFEQLSMLKPLMDEYDSFVVTEETEYKASITGEKMYYLHQINRKERTLLIWMVVNTFISLWLVLKEKPDIINTTGALAMIPLCMLVKLVGGKLIFIESFAKVSSPTKTGKFLYKYADQFYVQWEPMKQFYPEAIYLGGIY